MNFLTISCLLAFFSTAQSHVPHIRHPHYESSEPPNTVPKLARDSKNPADFSWVKRWAAIGDSYTAGIGSGSPLGSVYDFERLNLNIQLPNLKFSGHGNWFCARYDMAYPLIINRQLGGQVQSFQYTACSGDRTGQIYQQAQQLKGNLDMVLMTAGGNDLCLSEACEKVITVAEKNVGEIIKGNVKEILYELNNKMADGGIVVVNGYAEFFNEKEANCENQAWDAFWWLDFWPLDRAQRLTIDRRKRFNKLVRSINNATVQAINEIADDSKIKYKIGFADWNPWVSQAVNGQMCDPKSNGDYPDKKQPDIQFIKPDTHPWFNWRADVDNQELKRRALEDPQLREELIAKQKRREKRVEESIWSSSFFNSPNPPAIVRRILSRAEPKAPGCPGDDDWDWKMGMGYPNTIGANFHPNEKGHITIASFAMAEAVDLRSLVLGVETPSCEIKDQFKCYSAGNSKAYAQADRLDTHYQDFCKDAKKEQKIKGRQYEKEYDQGTPDHHQFRIQLGKDVADFNVDVCIDSMRKLIHSCDTNSKMNWKHGGQYVRGGGDWTYEVNPKRSNRPWPPPDKPVGRCEGWYKWSHSAYEIEGGGFSTWDWGQQTMLPSMAGCYGWGTSFWAFDYYDEPTKEGYEWKATFHTPIWVNSRCFRNNKVVKAAGGWTDGCNGND
ncbi:uncharacterized protein NECHADRAFT_51373 [Fusarium vanettenii 77-13-4]|uniref:Uncharacterized protein n=1 Tax=Fusarium vanettenii (strain ATCC MYA-4622 / CBS 123669 / FGSC 9596 / NRRL 45880 / 77-13-4) TaxID=660122 RepID=C7ZER8_FUSV7|nr:uncharacterized protein NECHADRAFT_51373 [Fusarium vanettenii 77-13-4]EEU37338.1 hypothetical protein NECHADRAFT_51373 [Fusarium vanettenii 77-13-4]